MSGPTPESQSCPIGPLADRTCVPCRGGAQPLAGTALAEFFGQVEGWDLIEDRLLRKTFKLSNFAEALALVNRIGALAEEHGHHPDLHLSWGKVTVELTTHKIGGLSESDFILAAKIDALTRS